MDQNLDSNLPSIIDINLGHYQDIYAGLPGGSINREEDLTWIINDIPHKNINILYGANFPEKKNIERIDKALLPYRTRQNPVHWWIGPLTQPPTLSKELVEYGFTLSWELSGMFASTKQISLPYHPDVLEVSEVLDAKGMSIFAGIFAEAHGHEEDVVTLLTDLWTQTPIGPGSEWRHFIGKLDNQSAATITLMVDQRSITILHLAVLPQLRKKGLASNLTLTALKTVCPDRDRLVVLHSTKMARSLYAKMGFHEVCKLTAYTWPGEEGN